MKRQSGQVYPNGVTKSRLYEVFLSHRDFGCTPDDYLFDLTVIRNAEANGEEHCHWYEDEHGRGIVDGLSLLDGSKVLQITNDGFKFVPVKHRVFISYAKEDVGCARRLYEALKTAGAHPWLDEEDLIPGQRWEIEIEAQIYQCNYFVALLSSRSVAKHGYVQREIRYALDVLQRIPEKDIFLIPARINECEPSHRALLGIQWVDLFPDWDAGLKRIFRSLGLLLT